MVDFIRFPDLSNTNEDGLLAMGGQLTIDALVSAYSQGIFPWFNEGQPVLWWSPDPRLVLYPSEVRVTRSLKKVIRNGGFTLRANTAFHEVVQHCAWRGQPRDQAEAPGTWITADMLDAYTQLHHSNYAHSIEVWHGDRLVGGLYGLALGKVFFGESMFSTASNASKVALWALCQWLLLRKFELIDCQISNDHLLSMGAREIPRGDFVGALADIDIQQASSNFADGFAEHFINLNQSE